MPMPEIESMTSAIMKSEIYEQQIILSFFCSTKELIGTQQKNIYFWQI